MDTEIKRKGKNHPTHTVPKKEIKNVRKHSEQDRDRKVFKLQIPRKLRNRMFYVCLALALQVRKKYNTMRKI